MVEAPATTQSAPRALDSVQRLTAERMMQSHLETARVSILGDADASELVRYFERRAAGFSRAGVKLTYTHLLIRVVALALRRHPQVNVSLLGNELQLHQKVNVGVAFAGPDGQLVVPVVHDADQLGIAAIAGRIAELQGRVQARKLALADVRGGTFTLTNLGMFPAISYTTPLINLPQCAILGVGRIREACQVIDGKLATRKLLGLSLTHDHRILNGYPAGAFFQTIADIIASPEQIEADGQAQAAEGSSA
jgi:pyruvate dehydrogenase E2 component (dihydrolipoamide acetyltransferase)